LEADVLQTKGEKNEQCNNVVQGNELSRPLPLVVVAFRYDLLTPRHLSALRTSHTWTNQGLCIQRTFHAVRPERCVIYVKQCREGTSPTHDSPYAEADSRFQSRMTFGVQPSRQQFFNSPRDPSGEQASTIETTGKR
jgi:hypothetical protein